MLSTSLQPAKLSSQLSGAKRGSAIQTCTSQNTLFSTRAKCHSPFKRVKQVIPVLSKGRFGPRCLKKFKVQGRSLQCHSCCTTMWKVCTAPMILMTENFSLLVRLLEDEPSWQSCLLALVEWKNYISVHNGWESSWGNIGLPIFTFTVPFIGLGEKEFCPRGKLVWKLCFRSEGSSADTLKSLFFLWKKSLKLQNLK